MKRPVVLRHARPSLLWLVAVLAVCATWTLYLGYTAAMGVPLGFPLDDSWIHQTFARNLAQTLTLTYNAPEPSTGSTSPLWTVLLAIGYRLPIDPRVWAYALGMLFLGLSAPLVLNLGRLLLPNRPYLPLLAALATILEWHLAWAGLSGMETTLFIFLSLALVWLAIGPGNATVLGLVGGLLTLTRPEGVVLFGLAILWRLLNRLLPEPDGHDALRCARRSSRARPWRALGDRFAGPLGAAALAAIVAAVVVSPDLFYNAAVSGTLLPATYYAKNAAYAVGVGPASTAWFGIRALAELAIGPLLLLYPGLIYLAVLASRRGMSLVGKAVDEESYTAGVPGAEAHPPTKVPPSPNRHLSTVAQAAEGRRDVVPAAVLPAAWAVALILLYAVRLPVVFHHGRYLMPLIPWLILFGLWGLEALLRALPLRLLARAYAGMVVIFWLVMWANGAVVYAWDSRFIDDEQVTVARWLRENTPPQALIASHDVGAIGYFAGRRLIDTAGLITPELALHVRDQQYVGAYLDRAGVEYLAMFPAWYPRLADAPGWTILFRVDQPYVLRQGAENMIVLRRSP